MCTNDCVYFETPYQKITNKDILRKELEYIINHEIKTLDFEVFSEIDNKVTVKFIYEYVLNKEERRFSGIYLVELENGLCNYFYQVGE